MRNFRPSPTHIPNIIKVDHTVPEICSGQKNMDGGSRTPVVLFRWSLIPDLADHMTINEVIGMSHGKQEPIYKSGRYHDIIHCDIIHHDFIHFALTKMADSQNCRRKYTRLLPIIYTFSGLNFQKPLTCSKNNIILHVHFNPKCIGE